MSSIQQQFEDSCLYVMSEEDMKSTDDYTNIIFETSQLKNRFFESLIFRDIKYTIINCLSSQEIFEKSLYNIDGIAIFDNVCACRNNEILKQVIEYKKKKLLVC